jgi:hypothetical protein
MKRVSRPVVVLFIVLAAACDERSPTTPSGHPLGFFVTSTTSVTGNLAALRELMSRASSSPEPRVRAAGRGAHI